MHRIDWRAWLKQSIKFLPFIVAIAIVWGLCQAGLMRFTSPWALLLLIPLVPWFYHWSQHGLVDLSTFRRRLSLLLRLLIVTLLVFALAGVQLALVHRQLCVIFCVDASKSVEPKQRELALKWVNESTKSMKRNQQAGVIVFADEPIIEVLPSEKLPELKNLASAPNPEYTDLASAMRLAMATFPERTQKRIILLTDGNENAGDAHSEAIVADSNGIQIDVVPLAGRKRPEVVAERLIMPSQAKKGEPFEIRLNIQSTQNTAAQIRLFRDNEYIGKKDVALDKGTNVFVFSEQIDKEGFHTYEALVQPNTGTDALSENNRVLSYVLVRGKPKVLYVEAEPEFGQFLKKALAREGIDVDVITPTQFPSSLPQLETYEAIILSNVPATHFGGLSEKQLNQLASLVSDMGTGLVCIGGDLSYSQGGYQDTALERVLPVDMRIRRRKILPNAAIVMIMHSSEFMWGAKSGDVLAQETAIQVVKLAQPFDLLGTLYFDWQKGVDWLWEPGLQPAAKKQMMIARLKQMQTGDMPDFDTTLKIAHQALTKAPAQAKHIIILSDGDPSPPSQPVVNALRAAKITVSTVCIGPHRGPSGPEVTTMKWLAAMTRGRFYLVQNPNQIPRIFIREIRTISRAAIIQAPPPIPVTVVEGTLMLKGIRPATIPPLLGYVITTKKAQAMSGMLSARHKDPLLAYWHYGLGKSVAFTSDCKPRWAAHWLAWGSYAKFWAQTVRWAMRRTMPSSFITSVEVERDKGKVVLEAIDEKGNYVNFLNADARVVSEEGRGQKIRLEQVAPGRYEGTFVVRERGAYVARVTYKKGKETVILPPAGTAVPYSPEYRTAEPNFGLLKQMAKMTGGKVLTKPEEAFRPIRRKGFQGRDVWWAFVLIALCLFICDVAVRRLAVNWIAVWEAAKAKVPVPRIRARPKPEPVTASPTLDRLLQRRSAQERTAPSVAQSTSQRVNEVTPQPATQPSSRPTPKPTSQPATKPTRQPSPADEVLTRLRQAKQRAREKQEKGE